MDFDFTQLINLTVAGVPIGVATFLVVQVAKFSGLIEKDNQTRIAALVSALVFAGVWFTMQFEPSMDYKSIVETAYTALLGALVGALSYQGYKFTASRIGKNK